MPSGLMKGLSFRRIVVALSASLLAPHALSQSCDTWLPGQGIPGFNSAVGAVATWDPDGPGPQSEMLVVSGQFTIVDNVVAKHVAAWDGTNWLPLGGGV